MWLVLTVGTTVVVILIFSFIINLTANNRKLKNERDFASDIFNSAGVLIIVLDREGGILRINKTCQKTTGLHIDEIVGKEFDVIIPLIPSTITQENSKSKKISFSDLPVNFESYIKSKNGEQKLISWSNTSIKDKQGIVQSYILSGIDITDLKRAQEKLIDYQNQQRLLTAELSIVEERERKRIAEDLHDRIVQTLAVAKIKLGELYKKYFENDISNTICSLQNQIQSAIDDTRNLIVDLSPPILHQLGFEAAVEALIDDFRKEHHFEIDFINDNQSVSLSEELSIFLYKAIRELLFNIVKHSQASTVTIELEREDQFFTIRVKDNGVGFDMNKNGSFNWKSGGFGLFNLKERLIQQHGMIDIKSNPGDGTQVIIKTPVRSASSRKHPGK